MMSILDTNQTPLSKGIIMKRFEADAHLDFSSSQDAINTEYFTILQLFLYKSIILNRQMSAKLESTYHQSPDQTAYKLKGPIVAYQSLDNSSSSQEVTDRFCANPSNASKNLQDIYLKETERYLIRSFYNSPVVLTEYQESSAKRSSSWKFFNIIENKKTQEEVNTLQFLLTNLGLLQVFRSFELFRERVIEILSNENGIQSNKSKIQIFQIITTLKIELEKMCRPSEEKDQYDQEIKDILVKVSKLRRENDFLRDKNSQLSEQLRKYENTQFSIQSSLIEDSIRFLDASELTDQSISQLSFDSQVGNMKINQLQTQSNSIYTSEKSLLQSIKKQLTVEAKQTRVEVVRNQQNPMSQTLIIQSWKQTVVNCIEIVKKLMKNQFEATSLALLTDRFQDKIASLLASYKSYKVKTWQQTEEIYLGEVNKFIQFISHNSCELASLVRKTVNQLKKAKIICN